ncbi:MULTISPECIES: subclass B3 metallo-beta-lactamase [unclassified Novosphingobium]|uniref:subclass B3 metallo-beta-lactamase n=1 Tax=unclassified Novosphingobium TaxID=2644732 RepID=UPI001357FF4D|nr:MULTISPECIES: subclass B3 metallo-beta-lactamase [unclassified Novosphingobium]
MSRTSRAITLAAALALSSIAADAAGAPSPGRPQTPGDRTQAVLATACAGHDKWADPAPPARIFGNTWYVGTCGISAILVTGAKGHILIDGGVAKAAPLVLANIRKAGFDPKQVRWIVASHEHFDHVGALAALQRETGAKVAALPAQKAVFETGKPSKEDPQGAGLDSIAPVKIDRVLKDGATVVVGSLVITAHATPVHAPGSTSWTWRSCASTSDCHSIAYADSTSTISSDGYRFTDHPDRVAAIRQGLPKIAALPCDILLTPHPSQSAMMERFAGTKPLTDTSACRTYVTAAEDRFAARLQKEAKEAR